MAADEKSIKHKIMVLGTLIIILGVVYMLADMLFGSGPARVETSREQGRVKETTRAEVVKRQDVRVNVAPEKSQGQDTATNLKGFFNAPTPAEPDLSFEGTQTFRLRYIENIKNMGFMTRVIIEDHQPAAYVTPSFMATPRENQLSVLDIIFTYFHDADENHDRVVITEDETGQKLGTYWGSAKGVEWE